MDTHIFFIYADNCDHCKVMSDHLDSVISKCKNTSCIIHKFKYDSKEAIMLAMNKGIDDLPGLVIGNKVFIKECTEAQIIDALKAK
jgi:glutaredoxin